MKNKLVVLFCLAAAVQGLIRAEEAGTVVSGPSTIESVTVYQNRCLVIRSISGEFSPGLYTWKFPDLPAQLLEESVRVSGRGTAVARILDLRIDRVLVADAVQEAVKLLEKRLSDIDREIQEVVDRLEVLNKKGDFVRGLSNPRPAEDRTAGAGPGDNPDNWRKRLDFVDGQLTLILEKVRGANAEKKELEKKRSLVQHELDQQAGLIGREKKAVLVDVEVTKAGTEKLEIAYVVPGVSWTPYYDVRIDSGKNEAVLTYQALVSQRTGEDWTDVRLSLSTAEPAVQNQMPQLLPWLVNTADSQLGAVLCSVSDVEGNNLPGVKVTVAREGFSVSRASDAQGRASFFNLQPGPYDLRAELMGFKSTVRRGINVRAGRSARLNIEMEVAALDEEVEVTANVSYEEAKAAAPAAEEEREMEPETTEAFDRTVAAVFMVKGKQTVPSSSEKKKVTIAIAALPVEKQYLSVPKLAENVSLVAKIANAADFPLLPGQASVFYDDDYISTAPIPSVSANDRFSVSVGEVPGLKARWRLAGGTRAETGLIGKKVQLTYEINITLENLLRTAQTVLVKDQIPTTSSKDVTIEILEVSPEPVKGAVGEGEAKDGIMAWSIPLAPMEKKEVKLKFRITHPKNSPLIDWNER